MEFKGNNLDNKVLLFRDFLVIINRNKHVNIKIPVTIYCNLHRPTEGTETVVLLWRQGFMCGGEFLIYLPRIHSEIFTFISGIQTGDTFKWPFFPSDFWTFSNSSQKKGAWPRKLSHHHFPPRRMQQESFMTRINKRRSEPIDRYFEPRDPLQQTAA